MDSPGGRTGEKTLSHVLTATIRGAYHAAAASCYETGSRHQCGTTSPGRHHPRFSSIRGGPARGHVPLRGEAQLASLDRTSSRGLRDRAIILCAARLGLRATEVVELELDDIDWRNGTVRVRRRKTGHGALLPLPQRVGAAVADYLRNGRPETLARNVFVLHGHRVGAPISVSIVGRAVDNALSGPGSTPDAGRESVTALPGH